MQLKKIYQVCMVVILLLSMLQAIAQLYCLLELPHLTVEKDALRVLKAVWILSIIVDAICVVVCCIAAAVASSISVVLCYLGITLFAVLIILVIVLILFSSKGSGSSGDGDCGSGQHCFCCCWTSSTGSDSYSHSSNDADCRQPIPTTIALMISTLALASLIIPIYLLLTDQWTQVTETAVTPFLGGSFALSLLRMLLAALILFLLRFPTNWTAQDEENRLLYGGDTSLREFTKSTYRA